MMYMGPIERKISMEKLFLFLARQLEKDFFSQLRSTKKAALRKLEELVKESRAAVEEAQRSLGEQLAGKGPGLLPQAAAAAAAAAAAHAPALPSALEAEAALASAALALSAESAAAESAKAKGPGPSSAELALLLVKREVATSLSSLEYANLFLLGGGKSCTLAAVSKVIAEVKATADSILFDLHISAEFGFGAKGLQGQVEELGSRAPLLRTAVLAAQRAEASHLASAGETLACELKGIRAEQQHSYQPNQAAQRGLTGRFRRVKKKLEATLRAWTWWTSYDPAEGKARVGWDDGDALAAVLEACLLVPPTFPWMEGALPATLAARGSGAAPSPALFFGRGLVVKFRSTAAELARTKEELDYFLEEDLVRSLRYFWLYLEEVDRLLAALGASAAALEAELAMEPAADAARRATMAPFSAAATVADLRELRGRLFLLRRRRLEVKMRLREALVVTADWRGAGQPHFLHQLHATAASADDAADVAEAVAAAAVGEGAAAPVAEATSRRASALKAAAAASAATRAAVPVVPSLRMAPHLPGLTGLSAAMDALASARALAAEVSDAGAAGLEASTLHQVGGEAARGARREARRASESASESDSDVDDVEGSNPASLFSGSSSDAGFEPDPGSVAQGTGILDEDGSSSSSDSESGE